MLNFVRSPIISRSIENKILIILMLFISGCFTYSQENVINWEYKVITILTNEKFPEVGIIDNTKSLNESNIHIATMQNMLNKYGINGWKLINIFPSSYLDTKEFILVRQQATVDIDQKGGLLVFTNWVDYNGDGKVTTNEMYGIGQKIFYYNEDIINLYFKPPENCNSGEVIFQSWTENGKKIGETKKSLANGSSATYYTNYRNIVNGDFMDNIGISGVGSYKIIALFNGIEYKIEITIQ